MKHNLLSLENERLFNSVEVELVRRWALGQVPDKFGNQPANLLKGFVETWWNLYHETECATSQKDRIIWQRFHELPALSLDTAGLVAALHHIRQLIVLETLQAFRPIEPVEDSALSGLDSLLRYFDRLNDSPS
ncbi:hypothetical protein [Spirosoma luteum]|uniref:hypothetical protein n=1 Tax=Spirosoma luteum TaxID=431553 RepID=UPI0012FC33DA|nr:hypothetical protein [Spirosoma luteum]